MSVSVTNTAAELSSDRLMTTADADTVTGAKTFDRDPGAPFVVTSGSAVVANLDADKLDGLEAAAFITKVGPTVFTSGVAVTLANGANSDLNPTGLATANTLFVTPGVASTITGITAPASGGTILFIVNVDPTVSFDLKANVTSTAANRFAAGTDETVPAGRGRIAEYYTTTARWHIIG